MLKTLKSKGLTLHYVELEGRSEMVSQVIEYIMRLSNI